jgi:hypothetical protein
MTNRRSTRFFARRVEKHEFGENPTANIFNGKWAVFARDDADGAEHGMPLIVRKDKRDAEEHAFALNWADNMDDFDRGDLYMHREDRAW